MNVKKIILLGIIIIIILFLPYFIKGKNCNILVHDNIDLCNEVGIFEYKFNSIFFTNEFRLNNYFPGENKLFLLEELKIDRVLFSFLGYFWGYVFNKLLLCILGFVGMFILLQKINKNHFSLGYSIPFFTALAFSMLPHWPPGNLTILGIPLIVLFLWNLYEHKHKSLSLLGLFCIPFYSSFVLSGVFILILVFFIIIFLTIRNKSISYNLVFGMLAFLIGYLISNYAMFYIMLVGPDTQRVEMIGSGVSIIKAIRKSIMLFKNGQYHAASLHKLVILPSIVMVLSLLKVTNKKVVLANLIFILLGFNIISSLVYGFSEYQPILSLYQSFHLGFQYNRFFFIGTFFWYLLFAIIPMNFIISYRRKVVLYIIILVQLLQIGYIYSKSEIFVENVSFKEIMSSQLFSDIKSDINYDKSDYIGCIGFFPSVANYNGFRTVGGYETLYSLEYKNKFKKIINKEIQQEDGLAKYFNGWGNRAYLFDNEIGQHYSDQNWIKENIKTIKCDLNLQELSKFGVKYLFTTVKISNAQERKIELVYETNGDMYYYRMYVYQI